MATIKDVAKLAGVSMGTVSNVLNGKKGVRLSNVEKVESAIKELGYQPNHKARSMRINKTMNVGVVLPGTYSSFYSQLFTGIERVLSDNDYITSLFVTSDIPANEEKILKKIQQQRMDGIIILTCQPENKDVFQEIYDSGIKTVFVDRQLENSDRSFIGFDNYTSFYQTTSQLLSKGYQRIALISGSQDFSSEEQCVAGYKKALKDNDIHINNSFIKDIKINKENAFKAAMDLLRLNKGLDVVLSTSNEIADGILMALSILEGNDEDRPLIVSLSEDDWLNNESSNHVKIRRKAMNMGIEAAEMLIENMEQTAFYENKTIILENQEVNILPKERNIENLRINTSKKPLKALMLDNSPAHATSMLLNDFYKKEGLSVELEYLNYNELYKKITKEALTDNYDVFQVEILWLREFVENNYLTDITELINANPESIEGLIPGILDNYAKYNNRYYQLPYTVGTQLLFYREDLFDDIKIQRSFYEKYRTELKPPETWAEFNTIARFFTRKYNMDSPTIHGTALSLKDSSGVLEFLPRLWGYGGQVFDRDGNISLKSNEAKMALKNFIESMKYASPDAKNYTWRDKAGEFMQGDVAMMILFNPQATLINDGNKSQVLGKIGYSIVPGGNPLIGGWSLGINKKSIRKDDAFKFISWASNQELAIPSTILGGSTPCINLYKSPALKHVYPWLTEALKSIDISRKKSEFLPKSNNGNVISTKKFEETLGNAIYRTVTNDFSADRFISTVSEDLNKLIKE